MTPADRVHWWRGTRSTRLRPPTGARPTWGVPDMLVLTVYAGKLADAPTGGDGAWMDQGVVAPPSLGARSDDLEERGYGDLSWLGRPWQGPTDVTHRRVDRTFPSEPQEPPRGRGLVPRHEVHPHAQPAFHPQRRRARSHRRCLAWTRRGRDAADPLTRPRGAAQDRRRESVVRGAVPL